MTTDKPDQTPDQRVKSLVDDLSMPICYLRSGTDVLFDMMEHVESQEALKLAFVAHAMSKECARLQELYDELWAACCRQSTQERVVASDPHPVGEG